MASALRGGRAGAEPGLGYWGSPDPERPIYTPSAARAPQLWYYGTARGTMPVTDAESFWIHIRLGDGELTPRGPFCSEDEAEAASARMGAVCRGILRQPV